MRIRSLPSTIGIVLLLPLPGCCSLARFFCGPDRTEWVSVDRATPEDAVKTLLESLRRSNPQILYDSLSDRYRDQLGVTGLIVTVGWEKFCEANPGLHVAGYAQVPAPTVLTDDRAEFTLDVEGTKVDVRVVRQLRARVTYRSDNGAQLDKSDPLTRFAEVAMIAPEPGLPEGKERSRLTMTLTVRHPYADEVPLSRIDAAGIETVWKIDDIHTQQAP